MVLKICKYCLISSLLWITNGNSVLAQSNAGLKLDQIHTYHFTKGYYLTFLEAKGDTVGLVCPNLNRVYLVNIKTKKMGYIKFKNGRGPGEISRGPFGIATIGNKIYLADTDNQRFSIYNLITKNFKSRVFRHMPLTNSIYYYNNKYILSKPKIYGKLAYYLYNPNKEKVVSKFYFPHKTKDTNRYSGVPTVSGKFLVHADRYYGDLMVWDIRTAHFVKRSVVKSVSKPKSLKAKFGKFTGSIPPVNPELKFIDLAGNPIIKHRVFILMKSKDGKYKTNFVYDYDFMKDKVVGTFKLPAKATLLATNENNLFVYSEDKDAMYQYKLRVK